MKNLLGDNVPRKYFKFSDYVRTLRRIMTLSIIMQKVPEIELTEDYGLWINWDYDLHSVSLKDNSLIMTSIATLEPIGTFTQRIALEMFAKDEALIIERG